MNTCPRCHETLPARCRFCPQCGFALAVQPAEQPPHPDPSVQPEPQRPDNPAPAAQLLEQPAAPASSAPPVSGSYTPPEPRPVVSSGSSSGRPSFSIRFQPGSEDWQAFYPLIGSNQDYYFRQFNQWEQFGSTSFNWAVFFFGPLVSLYRKSYAFFRRYYLGPLILMYLSQGMLFLFLRFYQPVGVVFSLFLLFGTSIWYLVAAILGGKKFNRSYYDQLSACQRQSIDGIPGSSRFGVSGGNVAIYLIITFLLSMIISVVGLFAVSDTALSSYNIDPYGNRSFGSDQPSSSYGSGTLQYEDVTGYYLFPDNDLFLALRNDGSALLHVYGSCGIPVSLSVEQEGDDFVCLTLTVPESYWRFLEISGNGDETTTLILEESDGQITQFYIDDVPCSFYRSSEENFYHTLRSSMESTANQYLTEGYYALQGEPVFQTYQFSSQMGVLAEENIYSASEYYIDDDYTLWIQIYSPYSDTNLWVIPIPY